ncbi:MAG: hypothetical protein R2809_06420 [Flavobacteriales bacterium]
MKLKRFAFLGLLFLSSMASFAQRADDEYNPVGAPSEPKKKKWIPQENLFYGGGLGLAFGNYINLNLNPQVGVKFTDWWGAGVGVDYNYVGSSAVNVQAVGPSVFTRFKFFDALLLQAEYNHTYMRYRDLGYEARLNFPMLLVGPGYQSGTGNGGVFFMVLWDLIQDPRSPFFIPTFRAGFSIGF